MLGQKQPFTIAKQEPATSVLAAELRSNNSDTLIYIF